MPEDLAPRAKLHGLRYTETAKLPLTRKKAGRGFAYFDAEGHRIRVRDEIDRINALVIPPAWEEVRIADNAKAHLQAVGRDSLGRLQYRYHDDWTGLRDKVKGERLIRFGKVLPKVRARIEKDLRRHKPDRRYAAATAARLIDQALLRSGHASTLDDGGRGATTLLNRDVQLNGTKVYLNFTGKGGKNIRKVVHDPTLLARLRKLKRIGRKRLFAFRNEKGACCYLTAGDLNAYLRDAAGAAITAKDFRTFGACAQAIAAFCEPDCAPTEAGRKRYVASVMKETAETLANTPAVTRSSYVHPMVVEAFEADEIDPAIVKGRNRTGLDASETALMRFLEDTLADTGSG